MRAQLLMVRQVAPVKPLVTEYVTQLLRCDPREQRGLKKFLTDKFIFKRSKNVESCAEDSGVVIKSIRMTAEHVQTLLQHMGNTDLKIVHLVRYMMG